MIAAAIALAYYGYRGAQDVVSANRQQFLGLAGKQALQASSSVELRMNAAVNAFFDNVTAALDDPAVLDKCSLAAVPLIEAFAVYGPTTKSWDCAGPSDKLNKAARERLRADIEAHQKDFEWKDVPPGQLKYVHTTESRQLLLVGMKRMDRDEHQHHLVVRLNLDLIRARWVDDQLSELGESFRGALVDERGLALPGAVFGGTQPSAGEQFSYADRFGKHLYAWHLWLAPQEAEMRAMRASMERQRVVQPLLVILSTAAIAVGLGIVLLAVMAERRASRLKSEFIANVSHELKTPLSLIRMFGEMVATGRHKGEVAAREYGGIITRESERLSHLIDNVLDFARLERGKASYDFAEGDLASVLERALDVCRYRLDKEKMRLGTRVEPSLPLVRMDENAVTLVIINLVDNALKYAADGRAVEVGLERTPGGVMLSVRDFGPGIPPEEQARIFERFYRAKSARDRNVRGSGIGLALVKHIAEAHGGRVTVESTGPGAGAVFRVFLPAPVVEGSESAERHDTAILAAARKAPSRV
jgi:two-component system phosphate regulon sensor histidine kinase PhoR